MAQRQVSSTNDHLTIAGLLVLGLTSALVGALVVAPTLAPKRMAMAAELPDEATQLRPTKKLPVPQSNVGAILETNGPANETGKGTRETSDTGDSGNAPGGNTPDLSALLGNRPSESTQESSVSIRKPGEIVGPPLPAGFKRKLPDFATESTAETTSKSRRTRDEEKSVLPDSGTSSILDETGSSSRRRNRRDSGYEGAGSERTAPAATPANVDPNKTDLGKSGEEQPADGVEPDKSARDTRVYRVQSGKFNTREEALKVQLELAKSGKNGVIVPAGDGYRLQLGVFRSRENAEKAAETARQQSIVVDVRPERQAQR